MMITAQIINWREFKDTMNSLERAKQVSKDLVLSVQRDGIEERKSVAYSDEGSCQFEYVKTENNIAYYEFLSTAQ
jgi:hypothetical protein